MISTNEVDLFTDDKNAGALRKAGADGDLGSWLKAHLGRAGAGDYVALLAYVERDHAHIDTLQHMRLAVRDKRHVATCANTDRASCIQPGKRTKAGLTAGYFCRSPPTMPNTLPCPARRPASA